jgi:uncharacterized protein
MKKILVISDTHGYIDEKMISYASKVDEVWHAGDIGDKKVLQELEKVTKVVAVYGNIDGSDIRIQTKEIQIFECEGITIMMTHIAGYPGKYYSNIQKKIQENSPQILVAGHSHILKVMHDSKNNLLFINPGAIGKSGFHTVRTMIQFEIDNKKPQNLAVIEYQRT